MYWWMGVGVGGGKEGCGVYVMGRWWENGGEVLVGVGVVVRLRHHWWRWLCL